MATPNLNKAAEQEKNQLNEGHDSAMEEESSGTVMVDILGKEFEVQKEMPGWVTMFIARWGEGDMEEVPPEKHLLFIRKMFGNEMLDHIIEEAPYDMNTQELATETVEKIQAVWSPEQEEAKKKK